MSARDLKKKLQSRKARVGVIGLGYVGLPPSEAFYCQAFDTPGCGVDVGRVRMLNAGRAPIKIIAHVRVKRMVASGRFSATNDFARLRTADAILICVPTPLTRHREPDISYVVETGRTIARHLRR